MKKLSYKYPGFFWNKNSGYGTKLHIDKIKLLGITPHHRKSFKPISTIYSAL
jgi:ribonuclease HII